MTAKLTLDADDCDAVVFDMDGVLTDTARVHAEAWKQTFDEFLEARARARGEAFEAFDGEADYRRFVDGRPRYDGVRSFLASRGIELEEGRPDDDADRETVCGLGNRKNQRFRERLRERGVDRFDDAVELVRGLRAAGISTAVISASRNARHVLERAGLDELFETRVDGVVADEEGLEGKPAPDVFVEAARRLGTEPRRCAVVEDALAGVEAGRRGGFQWVIGVARGGSGEDLERAGADLVVRDLSEIAVARSDRRRSIEALPSALDHVGAIAERIGKRDVVFFLDFDGTLAPIVDHPDDAALPQPTRALLADLSTRYGVAIVSGRDLDDLRARVALPGVYCAGSHGFRLAGPQGFQREHEAARRFLPALDEAEKRLRDELAATRGVEVERKQYALAVHTRRAPRSAAAEVRRVVERVRDSGDALRIGEGRKVLELRPALEWDKGKAISWLITAAFGSGAGRMFAIYVGDDATDEDAFRAVAGSGLAVVVRGRRGRTRASYALADPAAVRDFLKRLDETLSR